jgi:hypothetical protein
MGRFCFGAPEKNWAEDYFSDGLLELMELRAKLDDRDALKALTEDMQFREDGGFFTRRSEDHRVPYCPLCWTDKRKTVPLASREDVFRCEIHDTYYRTETMKERQLSQSSSGGRIMRPRLR